jgi:hypothetical protein
MGTSSLHRRILGAALLAAALGCSSVNTNALVPTGDASGEADASSTADLGAVTDVVTVADLGAVTDVVTAADLGAATDLGASTDVVAPRDTGAGSFCAVVDCQPGFRCCEARRACQPAGVSCPIEAIDAGPAPDVVIAVDAGPAPDVQTSFCAMVRCAAGFRCCEARRMCVANTDFCPGDPADAGAPDVPAVRDVPVSVDAPAPRDVPAPDVPTSFCAMVRCSAGFRCCEARRMCIADTDICPGDPADAGVVDAGPGGCASARECGAGQECVFPDSACARTGTCMTQVACLISQPFCACTGVTYLACRPDRPTQSRGICTITVDAGVGACASDRDCGLAQSCCPGTGRCYPTACLGCCMVTAGCTTNEQCRPTQYCAGTGCGTVGSCEARAMFCPLNIDPVCGCDGRTYNNSCLAAVAGVRVARAGACR